MELCRDKKGWILRAFFSMTDVKVLHVLLRLHRALCIELHEALWALPLAFSGFMRKIKRGKVLCAFIGNFLISTLRCHEDIVFSSSFAPYHPVDSIPDVKKLTSHEKTFSYNASHLRLQGSTNSTGLQQSPFAIPRLAFGRRHWRQLKTFLNFFSSWKLGMIR